MSSTDNRLKLDWIMSENSAVRLQCEKLPSHLFNRASSFHVRRSFTSRVNQQHWLFMIHWLAPFVQAELERLVITQLADCTCAHCGSLGSGLWLISQSHTCSNSVTDVRLRAIVHADQGQKHCRRGRWSYSDCYIISFHTRRFTSRTDLFKCHQNVAWTIEEKKLQV